MNRSSMRGIFLSMILLLSIVIISIPSDAHADKINVKSVALEETTIMTITNESNEEIKTIRIWLGSDFSFKSFKTEKEWKGEKTHQGVIIFTSSETIKSGESVKFGVRTDKVTTGINWKILDKADNQISTGKVLPNELPPVTPITDTKQDEPDTKQDEPDTKQDEPDTKQDEIIPSITSESIFKIIPTKPTVGSEIRVTGEKFGQSQEFDFYINTEKLGSFVTDDNGHFMTTMKIPDNQQPDRVDFKVKDKEGKEKLVSIRIEETDDRILTTANIPLTIQGLPDVIHRGDFLEIFGTGEPNGAVTSTVTNEEGEIINTRTTEIDSLGNWKIEDPIIIPLDTPFGKYSATITDGRDSKLQYLTVESDKIITIVPIKLKFDQGEIMKFEGTASPNKSIEIVLEDPIGKEIFSDILKVGGTGFVEFEYKTEPSAIKGTYTVIATQEKDKEFIFAGVGQLPAIPVILEFDQLNYKTGDIAHISLTGKASEIINLLIINPSDNPIGDAISITLQPDGTGTYELDLKDYKSGVYTAVISKGNAQSTKKFTVGLQTGSGKIEINTTKTNYLPGDSVLILGKTESSNVLINISLTDPDGKEIKNKETFSDKNEKITESSFRIPTNGKDGIWEIKAQSGSNFDTERIEVLATLHEEMQVFVDEGIEVPGVGQTIIINVRGASQTVEIAITAEDEEIIYNSSFPASQEGKIIQPWIMPRDTEPGTYTIKAEDAFEVAEIEFTLEEDNSITSGASIEVPDTEPPVIAIPADITVQVTDNSPAPVTFSVSATDNKDKIISPICSHNSGVDFPVGETIVTCDATDTAGNTSSRSFTITITHTG